MLLCNGRLLGRLCAVPAAIHSSRSADSAAAAIAAAALTLATAAATQPLPLAAVLHGHPLLGGTGTREQSVLLWRHVQRLPGSDLVRPPGLFPLQECVRGVLHRKWLHRRIAAAAEPAAQPFPTAAFALASAALALAAAALVFVRNLSVRWGLRLVGQ